MGSVGGQKVGRAVAAGGARAWIANTRVWAYDFYAKRACQNFTVTSNRENEGGAEKLVETNRQRRIP